MANINVTLNYSGSNPSQTALNTIAKLKKDARPIFKGIQPVLHKIYDNKFKVQGPGWAPHSNITTAIHGAHKILHLSGKLHRSLAHAGTVGSHERITPRRYIFGTTLKYAKTMEKGQTQTVTRNMHNMFMSKGVHVAEGSLLRTPARPYLVLSPAEQKQVQRGANAALARLVKKAETTASKSGQVQ